MRKDWVEVEFDNLLDYIQPTNYIVKDTEYKDVFKTPVLTAGKSFILGYTNETDGIFKNLPVIIFDDFTTATKYVNFEFKVKSSAMKILSPTSKKVNLKYVFYGMQVIHESADTHKRYWISVYAKKQFPLAPLPEQRAIVSKIELLFSELDNAVSNLKQAKDKLEIFRQSVLKKAFEGELTKESKKWEKKKLGDVIKIKSGDGLSKSNRNDTGKYLVYGGNGVTGRHSEYMFEEQRLIIGRVGVHCGNAYITKPNSWVTDNAFVVDFDKEKIDIMFLLYLIGDLNLNQYSNSTAQPVISGGTVYPVEFYLPNSIEEQQEIVKEIETRFSVADKLAESIDESLLKAEALRQSILKKAFEGELLSKAELDSCRKETDWEPAEKLLERIKKGRK
jgi:type I restriction enzyme, S subunit